MCVHLEAHQFETRLFFTPFIKLLSTQVLSHHQPSCNSDCSVCGTLLMCRISELLRSTVLSTTSMYCEIAADRSNEISIFNKP